MTKHNEFIFRAQLLPPEGVKIAECLPVKFLNELLFEADRDFYWEAMQDGNIQATLVPQGNTYRLRGEMGLQAKHACVRCLSDVVVDLKSHLDLTLMEGVEPEITEAEIADEDAIDNHEDDSLFYFQNGIIDVVPVIREQLFLELPLFPTCDKDCHFEPVLVGPTPDAVWEDPTKTQLRALKTKLPQ